jgi:hypothetical protein
MNIVQIYRSFITNNFFESYNWLMFELFTSLNNFINTSHMWDWQQSDHDKHGYYNLTALTNLFCSRRLGLAIILCNLIKWRMLSNLLKVNVIKALKMGLPVLAHQTPQLIRRLVCRVTDSSHTHIKRLSFQSLKQRSTSLFYVDYLHSTVCKLDQQLY